MPAQSGAKVPTPVPSPRFPKTVPVYFRRAKDRLVHITLSIAHRPDSFREVLNALPGNQVNLLAVNISNGAHEGFAEGHIFAEIDPSLSPKELEEKLRRVPAVRHVRVQPDLEGRLIDDSHPLRVSEAGRVLLFSQASFASALNRMRDAMGPGGSVLLYDFGQHMGEELVAEASRAFGVDFVRANLGYSLRFFSAMGWGQIELVEADVGQGHFRLLVRESFECFRAEGAKVPRAQLIRGMFAGTFAGLVGAPVSCTETKCIAQGDPYCEFEVDRVPSKSADALVLPG